MKNWLSSSSFFRAQRLIILALVVVLSLQQAQGATITVPPGSTLSSVLAGSANGDVLQLQSGTYYVTAQVNLTDSGARSIIGAGAQSSIIVPSSSNSFTRFLLLSGGSLTIENVALRDFSRDPAQLGDSVLAGSVFQVAGGTLTLNNCQATDNNAQEQDGGVLATWSGANKQIIISDCVFDSNQASHGSALAMLGVAEAATVTVTDSSFTSHINTVHGVIFLNTDTNADVTLTRLTFSNNVGSDRGVLHNDSGSITVTDSYFGGNVADSGATISLGPAAQFQAINCTFERNQARAGGGCVRSTTSFPIAFKQCVFLYNSAPNQAGAIEVDQPYYLIDECYFEGNSAPLGGAFLAPPNAGSAPITSNLITRSVFVNNIGSTGGAAIWASIAIRVSNCTFINNTAGSGGAILQNNQAIWLSDSYFTGNSARNGGAIFSTSDAEFHFFGSIEIIKNKASTLGGGMLLSGSAIIETGAVVHVANNSVNTGGGGVALADITDFVVEGQLLIEHNRAVLGAGLYVDAASYAACSVNTTEQTLLLNNNRAVIGGGGVFFATSSLSVDCPHINATFTDNVAPYGVDEGSYPSIIDWELVVPDQIRVGEHFTQTGQLLDIFSKPVRAASTLLSFEMSIIANNKSKPEQVSLVSLVGLTTTAPRDLDSALRFQPFVTGSSGAQLPMSFSLAIVSRPQLLPTQYFDITLTTCEGGYTSYVVDGELFCLELITASDWARAVAGAAAGVGLLVVGFMWLLLFIKPDKMVHFGRTASVACLHAVCLGSFVILISIFPWMEDNDSNCVARPWLAVIGLTIMLSGLFVISFADFLRSQQRSPSDLIMLIIVLTLSLIANIVVLIVWTAQDPYELLQEVGLASNTLKQYCYSSDTVYIWILVGFYAGLGALYLLSLFLQRNLSFRFRQSKHFSLYSIQAAAVSAAMIPVAAVYFTDLDVFFLVTTLGLVGVAVLPVIPLVGLRVYRVFYPMEGDRRNQHVEWLIKDHRHRQSQVTQIASGSTAHTSSPHLPATESVAYSRNNSRNTRTL